MDGTKIFIVVLIVIIILFIVGVGAGARHDPNDPNETNANINSGPLVSLQQLLAKPQSLALRDISSATPVTCIQGAQLVVPRFNTCIFSIQASGAAVRRITLGIFQGNSIEVTLDQPKALKVTQNLPADASEHLDVYQNGGTLQIRCTSSPASTCILALQ